MKSIKLTAILAVIFVASSVFGMATLRKRPTLPTPTSDFCVNKNTHGMRMLLEKNGVSLGCHKFESEESYQQIANNTLCIARTGALFDPTNGTCKPNQIPVVLSQLAQNAATPTSTPSSVPTTVPEPAPSETGTPAPPPTPTPTPSASPSGSPTPVSVLPGEWLDANSNLIGYNLDFNQSAMGPAQEAVMNINGTLVGVGVTPAGFPADSGDTDPTFVNPPVFEYTQTNCQGPPYLTLSASNSSGNAGGSLSATPLVISAVADFYQWFGGLGENEQAGFIVNGLLMTPSTPYQEIVVQSELVLSSADPFPPFNIQGTCAKVAAFEDLSGLAMTVDLNRLGYVTPFRLVQP